MRKSRFTEEQIIAVLKEHAAGTPAQELGRRLGVGVETLYRWKRKYGGMEVSDATDEREHPVHIEFGQDGWVVQGKADW